MSNRMSRRGFFTVLFSAMAAGTMATCPALGDAIEQFGDNSSKEIGNPDKIANLFRMYRGLLQGDKYAGSNAQNVIALFEYMNSNFDPAIIDHYEAFKFSANPRIFGIASSGLTEEALAKLAEGLVPFAVARELAIYHNIGFSYFDDTDLGWNLVVCSQSGVNGVLALPNLINVCRTFEKNYNISQDTYGAFWIKAITGASSPANTYPVWQTYETYPVWTIKTPGELQKEKYREQLQIG